jgi:hypothetical protein
MIMLRYFTSFVVLFAILSIPTMAQDNPFDRLVERDGPIETWSPTTMWINYHEMRKLMTEPLFGPINDAIGRFNHNPENRLDPECVRKYGQIMDTVIRQCELVINLDDSLLSLAEGGAYTPDQIRSVREARDRVTKFMEFAKDEKTKIPVMLDDAKRFSKADQEIAKKVKENPYWPITVIAITQDKVKDTVQPIPGKLQISSGGELSTFDEHPARILADIKAGKDIWLLDKCQLGTDDGIDHHAIYVIFSGTTMSYIIDKHKFTMDHKTSYLWSLYSIGDSDQTYFTNSKIIDHWDGASTGTEITITHKNVSDFQWASTGDLGAIKRL